MSEPGLKKITKEDLPAIFKKDINKNIKWLVCLECRQEFSKLILGLCGDCKAKKDREELINQERKDKDFLLDKVDN
jgi:hypothetical protein